MKKLNVLGMKVSIKVKNPADETANAEWHHEINQIWIRPNTTDSFSLICHELIHAVFTRSGVYQAQIHEHIEEVICESIANVLNENILTLYQMHNKLSKYKKK